jgi:hypothetical protein
MKRRTTLILTVPILGALGLYWLGFVLYSLIGFSGVLRVSEAPPPHVPQHWPCVRPTASLTPIQPGGDSCRARLYDAAL